MVWIAVIVVVAIIAACLDSTAGKIVIAAGVVALALWLLSWITGAAFLITLAKVCVVVMVLVVVWAILMAIFGN